MVLPAEAAEFGEVYRMRARDTKAESAAVCTVGIHT
jgi:hypothetical protein